jgi:hypothetical protein
MPSPEGGISVKIKKLGAVALMYSCACGGPAVAQNPPPAAAAAEAVTKPEASIIAIPALTVVELEFIDSASSRTSASGDVVKIRLAEPLTVDGKVVVPAGTAGAAEVIQASKARMMGKAGELTLAARYLEIQGVKIPLKRFQFGRSSGRSNTTETMIATALIGLPGLLISGGNIDVAAGARAKAVVARETFVTPPDAQQPNPTEGGI